MLGTIAAKIIKRINWVRMLFQFNIVHLPINILYPIVHMSGYSLVTSISIIKAYTRLKRKWGRISESSETI
jgi:hypothetical protein